MGRLAHSGAVSIPVSLSLRAISNPYYSCTVIHFMVTNHVTDHCAIDCKRCFFIEQRKKITDSFVGD